MREKIIILALLVLPVFVLAQENMKKKAYYFYGEQCSHCKTVDEYFQANGIYEKYEITKLEVTSGNPFNQKLFLDFGKAFGKEDWGGVPAIVFGDKYLLGDKPIIDNFVQQIEVAENANELSKPENIKRVENPNSQTPPAPSNEEASDEGKKKDYFAVIIGALVVLGAGALIFVNRK